MSDRNVPTSLSPPPVPGVDYLNSVAAKFAMLFNSIALQALTVENSVNDYTITVDPVLNADVVSPMTFFIKPNVTNVDGSPVRVRVTDANPYYEVVKSDNSAFAAGEWSTDTLYQCTFFDGKFVVVSRLPTSVNIPTVSEEIFNTSGTWNKPSNYAPTAIVEIECWGAGGGGVGNSSSTGRYGGGGGGYNTRKMLLSELSLTESVTVGSGGAGGVNGVNNGNGAAGTATSFGSHVTAGPGGGGTNTSPGTSGHCGLSGLTLPYGGGVGGNGDAGGGVGGNGANAWIGGGGGGGGAATGGNGGTSVHGGNGGAGASGTNNGTVGSAPGGGGGAGTPNGGAGAAGRVRIRIYP